MKNQALRSICCGITFRHTMKAHTQHRFHVLCAVMAVLLAAAGTAQAQDKPMPSPFNAVPGYPLADAFAQLGGSVVLLPSLHAQALLHGRPNFVRETGLAIRQRMETDTSLVSSERYCAEQCEVTLLKRLVDHALSDKPAPSDLPPLTDEEAGRVFKRQ